MCGPTYVQRFGDRLLPSHRRVLRDVVACRTPTLGGQMYLCHGCGCEHSVYFSCRNRHCPKCQAGDAERWLERQRGILLPCEYGFATCKLPADLREVARSHQRVVYSILMHEAAYALFEMAGNRLFIGGLTGIMAVLQTWTGAQIYHRHVHMLFPVGGLGENGDSWVKPKKRTYILPGYGLAKVFRKRVEVAFRKAGLYDLVPRKVWHRRWVANVKRVGVGSHRPLKDRHLFLKHTRQPFFLGFEVEPKLEVEPESLAGSEEARKPQRCIGRDGPLPVDDFVDAPWRNADLFCQAVLADLEGVQELLQEDFARMYWVKVGRSHFISPCGSRRSRPRLLHRSST